MHMITQVTDAIENSELETTYAEQNQECTIYVLITQVHRNHVKQNVIGEIQGAELPEENRLTSSRWLENVKMLMKFLRVRLLS